LNRVTKKDAIFEKSSSFLKPELYPGNLTNVPSAPAVYIFLKKFQPTHSPSHLTAVAAVARHPNDDPNPRHAPTGTVCADISAKPHRAKHAKHPQSARPSDPMSDPASA
jgi:hypothetical protein